MFTLVEIAAILVVLYLASRLVSQQVTANKPFPPGPRGYPIIGNLFQWPKQKEWETFSEWAQTYGNIVYLNLAGKPMVIINSHEVARDILERKGGIYSDRPHLHFAKEMSGYSNVTVLLDDTTALKEQRRIFAREIGTKRSVEQLTALIETKTKHFVKNVLENPSPDTLCGHLHGYMTSILLETAYGYHVKDGNDDIVDLVQRADSEFSLAAAPGAHLVDMFPWIEHFPDWLPGMGFKEEARKYYRTAQDFAEIPYNFVVENMASGTAHSSVVSRHLQNEDVTTEEQRSWLKWAAATFYGAGSDTTTQTMHGFFLNMVLFPEVQTKAQAELDAIIKVERRLPTLEDRMRLPYIDALVTEVYRRTAVVRQGIPHRARTNDIYEQYFIPKDATIIPNIWFMCNNPEVYKDPSIFNPDRYLGEHPEPDPRTRVFGYGRRMCPGRLFADNVLFLLCATSLAVFDILPAQDKNGHDIIPLEDWNAQILCQLAPFDCVIKPRPSQIKELLGDVGA